MDSQCLMVNCRRKAPDDQAFCAKHRGDTETIAAQFKAAQEVIAEQLAVRQRLEEERDTHLEAITNLGAIITRLRRNAITHVCRSDAQKIADWLRTRGPADGADFLADLIEQGKWRTIGAECPHSPAGFHIVDTSMESGPNNCFHCEAPMPRGKP